MVNFLLGRVKLNMTLVVTATGALCRSEAVFLLDFLLHFLHSNFKTVHVLYFSVVTYCSISPFRVKVF